MAAAAAAVVVVVVVVLMLACVRACLCECECVKKEEDVRVNGGEDGGVGGFLNHRWIIN